MIRIKVFTATVVWLLLATMISVYGCSGQAVVRTVVSETLVTQIVDATSTGFAISTTGSYIVYSPDGRRVAYVADKGGKKYVVVDGVPGEKGYDAIGFIIVVTLPPYTFSPDSKRVAYVGITRGERTAGNKWSVVIDGEEGDTYSGESRSFTFSPDSKHVAYWANGIIFLDRVPVKGPPGTVVTAPLFSPDSQQLVYVVEQSGKQSVVVDGIPGKQYDRISSIAFSPDSKHLAYWGDSGNFRFMVVDGKERERYETGASHIRTRTFRPASYIVFSPDSKHLAYVAGDKYGTPEHAEFVVLDGKELTRHKDNIYKIVFSPDSNHIAYGGEGFVVVDGVEKEIRSSLSINSFVFSPDSTRYAYKDVKTSWIPLDTGISASWVVVDGVKGKKYKGVGDITFSPDSKHVAYTASDGKKGFLIVDEIRGKEDMSGSVVWDSADRFHYLDRRDNSIYLVEETLTED